jgi:hypothetical protein
MSTMTADLAGRSQFTTALDANTRKAISGSSAELGPMVAGAVYFLRSDANAFFRQGATGVSVTTSTGVPIFAQESIRIYCDNVTNNGYVAVITSGGTGTAYLVRVD